MRHDSFIHVLPTRYSPPRWDDWLIYVTWIIEICDMTRSHKRHGSFIHVCITPSATPRHVEMTHLYMWHNSLKYVTWLTHTSDMIHLYMYVLPHPLLPATLRRLIMWVSRYLRDVTHSYTWQLIDTRDIHTGHAHSTYSTHTHRRTFSHLSFAVLPQTSPIHSQKSPIYSQNSPIYSQKSPI